MKFSPVFLLLQIIVLSRAEHVGFFSKLLPNSLSNFFTPSFLYEKAFLRDGFLFKTFIVSNDTAESGNLDFLGRDLFNMITRTTSHVSKYARNINSYINNTLGLDTNSSFFNGTDSSGFKNYVKAIFPGTKWCGGGDRAENDDDLGTFEALDKCCRDHDKCEDSIAAGATKYDLTNNGIFTRSLCECDWNFYICLKNERKSIPAFQIGHTYFTVLGPQCFKSELQKIGCDNYELGKCTTYQFVPNSTKTHQWFDSPPF